KRKLPSMYHQFKQLADLDITEEPMEVGPTTHYAMGGVRVESDSQMTTVPGLFAAGECATGLHGANRLGGNSLSDLVVFGQRAGEYAVQYVKEQGGVNVADGDVEAAARDALAPFDRDPAGESPFHVQYALQDMMQEKVGIIRTESELDEALDALQELKARANKAAVQGNREWNAGWHTSIELRSLMTVSEAIARAARERTESRGAHTRDDHAGKNPEWGKYNLILKKGENGDMEIRKEEIPPIPDELKQIIEEQG
ncbi:MAG: FAD-binding protein, partial [Longimicrobiales bacterium]